MATITAAREFGWRVITKAGKSPAGPLLRSAARKLDTWKGFTPTAQRLDDLTVDAGGDRSGVITRAEGMLRQHGIVVLTNVFGPTDLRQACEEAHRMKRRGVDLIAPGVDDGESDDAFWQVRLSRFKSYGQLASAPKPVIYLRNRTDGGYDAGMFEVYNTDRLARSWGLEALAGAAADSRIGLADEIVGRIAPVRGAVINLYQNDEVTGPRGLHIDCLATSYKTFVYLSDCTRLGDGPYCYVPGTQARPDLLVKGGFVNCANGGTDTDFPELESRRVAMLGRSGTVIISAQFGAHGGQPQVPGASRSVLVKNYRF